MVKKQLFLSGLFCLGFFYSFIEAGYTEKLKGQTRTQLKKIESEIFTKTKHLDARILAEARQLLDALIKKENFEQFEKSIEEFYKRNLIDDKQKAGFLKKNKLRKENNAIIRSINDINNDLTAKGFLNEKEISALVDAHKQFAEDLTLEKQSDVSAKENKQKYAALKEYTDLIGNLCSGYSLLSLKNMALGQVDPMDLQLASAFFSVAYLLSKAASFLLLEKEAKAELLTKFIDAIKSVEKIYHIIPENAKIPVMVIEYGAKLYPHIPAIKKIAVELDTLPLEEVMY